VIFLARNSQVFFTILYTHCMIKDNIIKIYTQDNNIVSTVGFTNMCQFLHTIPCVAFVAVVVVVGSTILDVATVSSMSTYDTILYNM